MAGGTEFHFVTKGIHAALEQATSCSENVSQRVRLRPVVALFG